MGNLFWLTDEQMERKLSFFPRNYGRLHMNNRRVSSGLFTNNLYGLRPRDARRLGFLLQMMEVLATEGDERKVVMVYATYLKAYRTASSLRVKKEGPMTSAGI